MYNPKIETLPLEELRKLQNERLSALVARIYQDVPAYREKLDDAGTAAW